MTHPKWCSVDRCEADDASPGSSRAHRSETVCFVSGDCRAITWLQQVDGGAAQVALLGSVRSVGGPVVLLDCDVAGDLSVTVGGFSGR